MRITKRFKDTAGITVAYGVSDGRETFVLQAATVLSKIDSKEITNAIRVGSTEVRAKSGEHIETVMLSKGLAIAPVSSSPKAIKSAQSNTDYFGKNLIEVCKKIRRCANAKNVIIDQTQHKSNEGRNTHLFRLIEACGLSIKTVVLGYLSVIQPYAVTLIDNNSKENSLTVVSDIGYRVPIYIKIKNIDESSPIVISFHENNVRGSTRGKTNVDFNTKLCAVFVNQMLATAQNYYNFTAVLQRGLIRTELTLTSRYYNSSSGVALVEYAAIQKFWQQTLDNRLAELSNMYYISINENDDMMPEIRRIIDLNGVSLSFISCGYATVNNLCMLMDLFSFYTDSRTRRYISDLACNILLESPRPVVEEIIAALEVKYPVGNKLLLALKKI